MANAQDVLVNSLLGPNSSFKGDIEVHGFARVDGRLSGSLRSSGKVVISKSACCDASVLARSAIIGGIVKGDVCVLGRLSLLEGAVIVGNVFASVLDAAGDVTIHGNIEVSCKPSGVEEAMLSFIRKHGSKIRPFGFSDGSSANSVSWQK